MNMRVLEAPFLLYQTLSHPRPERTCAWDMQTALSDFHLGMQHPESDAASLLQSSCMITAKAGYKHDPGRGTFLAYVDIFAYTKQCN